MTNVASDCQPRTPRVAGGNTHVQSLKIHSPSGVTSTSNPTHHHHKHHHSSMLNSNHHARHSHPPTMTSTSQPIASSLPPSLNPKSVTEKKHPVPPSPPLSQPPAYTYPLSVCNTFPVLTVDKASKSPLLPDAVTGEPSELLVARDSCPRQRRRKEKMSSSHAETSASGLPTRHKVTSLDVETEGIVGQNRPAVSSTPLDDEAVADHLNYAANYPHRHNHKHRHNHRQNSSQSSGWQPKYKASPVDLDLHELDLGHETNRSTVHLDVIKARDGSKEEKSRTRIDPALSPPTTSYASIHSDTKLPNIFLPPVSLAESSASHISRNRIRKLLDQFYRKRCE